ncbi:MAG TPA: hypothetical protein DEQ47_11280 [Solibacterales bacterium]|nr:hypothetical protein [Bryobacterales bacterium]
MVSVETAAEGIHAAARPADYTVSISSDDGVVIIPVIARAAKRRAKTKRLTLADAAQLLQDEDKDALVRMLLDWAQEDPVLQRLLQHAARRSSPEAAAFVHALEALREKYKIKRNFLKLLEELTEDAESGVNLQTAGSSVKKLVTLTTSPSRSMCRYSSRRPKWPLGYWMENRSGKANLLTAGGLLSGDAAYPAPVSGPAIRGKALFRPSKRSCGP